jgi:hypothetical protein
MVENVIHHNVANPAMANDVWRSRHGFKETHVHNPPYRKNRDFKAVPFGTFRGMPNYKHSEPFLLMKNLKDLQHEDHHHPTRWAKAFLFGAIVGASMGYAFFVVKPI